MSSGLNARPISKGLPTRVVRDGRQLAYHLHSMPGDELEKKVGCGLTSSRHGTGKGTAVGMQVTIELVSSSA